MNRTLIDIGDDLRMLDEMMEECGGELIDAEFEKWFDTFKAATEAERDEKIDRYCYLIDDLTKSAARHQEDADTYAAWARADKAKADRLKARLQRFFEEHGIQKLPTAHYRPRIQGNGGDQPLMLTVEPEKLPKEFQKVTVSANGDLIRACLAAGKKLEFAKLLPRGQHLRLR